MKLTKSEINACLIVEEAMRRSEARLVVFSGQGVEYYDSFKETLNDLASAIEDASKEKVEEL